jgi:predicted  nucleic acid-binding Zn-ribbon protein
MQSKEMIEQLTQRGTSIREELVKMEQEFNQKKEEFLKIQGALEALYELDRESSSTATE